jgi:hypothetical protein
MRKNLVQENHMYHCSSEKMGIEYHRVMKKEKKKE